MGDYRYRAFISYSHADEEWGAWLQRSLERFRAPADLARQIAAEGRSARLSPVFRDREDLPVAGNLNEAIQKALAEAEFQIVLCSPNAAKSRWVNEEIKLFHRLHGAGRTFAIIVAGEPGGGAAECFPPALRLRLGPDGEPTDEPHETLAADAREQGDGRRYALLKTAAGMLGVGLDDLVRREARAKARRTRAIVAGTSAIAASMTFAAIFAINQRNEARVMRGKAETLVEFMLTDLSDRLGPVGRLDILEEVGGEVLDYYADQDIKTLDAPALSRRAQALIKLGAVDQRRGDLVAALKAFEAAFASTEEQLRRTPNNPDRIFDHAQSVFYLGSVASDRGEFDAAEAHFQVYDQLAEKLIAIDPGSRKWRLEKAYATSNLGSIRYNRGDYAAAIPYFETSSKIRAELAAETPGDRGIAFAHASALSWLAYAQLATGDFADAIATLKEQLAIYDARSAGSNALDYESLEKQITAERRLAQAHFALGDLTSAGEALARASTIGDQLLAREPGNMNSQANVGITARLSSYDYGLKGDVARERAEARRAYAISKLVLERQTDQISSKLNYGAALVRVLTAGDGDGRAEAQELETLLGDPALTPQGEHIDLIVSGSLALARRLRRAGEPAAATARALAGVGRVRESAGRLSVGSRMTFAELLLEAGLLPQARSVAEELFTNGVRHPELLALRGQIEAITAGEP